MRLSSLLLLGFLEKTQAGIGDGRQLARLVMPYTVCEAKDGELELGEYTFSIWITSNDSFDNSKS